MSGRQLTGAMASHQRGACARRAFACADAGVQAKSRHNIALRNSSTIACIDRHAFADYARLYGKENAHV